jgi:integrase/recombinase XerD
VWLAHYQRSANTRAAYARELLLFLGWLGAQRIDAFAVRGAHVERYLRRLQRAGLAEASRAPGALAALAAYYTAPCTSSSSSATRARSSSARPRPRRARTRRARSARLRCSCLLDAAHARAPLHELLASLLFYNALRVSEAVDADVADVGQHQGLHVLAVRGKGETEKNVRVPLNHETARCPTCATRRAGTCH